MPVFIKEVYINGKDISTDNTYQQGYSQYGLVDITIPTFKEIYRYTESEYINERHYFFLLTVIVMLFFFFFCHLIYDILYV